MRPLAIAFIAIPALMAMPLHAGYYADNQEYLPPPGPANFQETLREVSKLPAFQAMAEQNAAPARMEEKAAPAIRYAQNYQVPAIPAYLPMNRSDAQNAPHLYPGMEGTGVKGTVQYAAFIQQTDPAASSQGSAQQASPLPQQMPQQQNYQPQQPFYGQPPLMAQEPVGRYASSGGGIPAAQPYASPVPSSSYGAPQYQEMQPSYIQAQPAPLMPAPVAAQPLLMAEAVPMPSPNPAPVPMMMPVQPQPMMDYGQAPVYAPQPQPYPQQQVLAQPYNAPPGPPPDMGTQVSMAYNPPVMQGNPVYEPVDVPRRPERHPPSLLLDRDKREAFYVGFHTSYTLPSDTSFASGGSTYLNDYYPGWGVNGSWGYAFRPWAYWIAPRVEAEIGTMRQSVEKQTVGATSFTDPDAMGDADSLFGFFNAYLDVLPFGNVVVPYIGAGIGLGYTDFDRQGVNTVLISTDDYGLAWNAGAGFGFAVGHSTMIDVGYRFVQIPDLSLRAIDNTTSSTALGAHTVMLGLRQSF